MDRAYRLLAGLILNSRHDQQEDRAICHALETAHPEVAWRVVSAEHLQDASNAWSIFTVMVLPPRVLRAIS